MNLVKFRNIFKRNKVVPKVIPKVDTTSQFCECTSCSVQEISFIEFAPLVNGHWTQFLIEKCINCGKIKGFPHDNLLTALKYGTKETLDKLEKIGIDIDRFRKDNKKELRRIEKEELDKLNPSYRK